MKKSEIKEILKKHKLWLEGNSDGIQANLSGLDLSYMNLRGVNLSHANLRNAYLTGACLEGANLSEANLRNATLSGVNLFRANLRGANLIGVVLHDANLYKACLDDANLSCAKLRYANLCYADLNNADLKYATLSGANLIRASLRGANLIGAVLHDANLTETCLNGVVGGLIEFRTGKILTEPLIGYKKCRGNVIVTLEIPKDAIVFSINGYKCRTNKVKVLAIDGANRGLSYHNDMSYYPGDEITIWDFSCKYNEECATGIHFFINREDAENY